MAFLRNKQVRRLVALLALASMVAGVVLTTFEMKHIGITVLFIGICATGFLHFDASVQRRAASAYPIAVNPIQSAISAVTPTVPTHTGHPKQTLESV
jgi:hypothetical protein